MLFKLYESMKACVTFFKKMLTKFGVTDMEEVVDIEDDNLPGRFPFIQDGYNLSHKYFDTRTKLDLYNGYPDYGNGWYSRKLNYR